MSPRLSAILSHLLSRWSISQAAWCLLWWICQIWWFPQRHAREGWVIGLPPLSGLWHGQLIFGRTEISFTMVRWLQVWLDAKCLPQQWQLHPRPEEVSKVSEKDVLAFYFQNSLSWFFDCGKWFSFENIWFPLFDILPQCGRVIES